MRSHIERASIWLAPAVLCAFLAVVHVGGCASAEIDDPKPDDACESNTDCDNGEVCDIVRAACVPFNTMGDVGSNNGGSNNGQIDMSANNGGSNDAGSNNGQMEMGAPDTDSTEDQGGEEDMNVTCSPTCEANEVCDNGSCVSACSPPCQSPKVCTATGCEIPDCTTEGAPCDLNNVDQGQFACLPDDNGDGVCRVQCDEPNRASTCDSGQYCVAAGSPSGLNYCLDSECTSHSDCTNGSCVALENDFGTCVAGGSTLEGESCNTSTNGCEPGTYCRALSSGSSTGVCSSFCEPWAATPGCGFDEVCAHLFTSRQGLCTDQLDSSGANQPFQACNTPGDKCDHAISCFQVSSTDNACLKYCRPTMGDCQGVLPDGSDGVCNNFVFAGDRTLGICFATCDPVTDPCGTGLQCDNGMCRTQCTAGNELSDCCEGTTPCDFTCVNGLCE